jgi:hypothetical protein
MTFLTGLVTDCPFDDGYATKVGDSYLAQWLEQFWREQVYCAYAIDDAPITLDRMRDLAILSAEGLADADLSATYSEITGFLWVNERGTIGGHDLIDVIETQEGKYAAILVQREPIDWVEVTE